MDTVRILVTSGAGAIRNNMVRRLNELETRKIMVLDDLFLSYEWNVLRGGVRR